MEFLTKNEYYGILSLKKQYVNKDYDINNELIAQYSELSLRKRNELINTLHANIINNTYTTTEDLNSAKSIIAHLLISIDDKTIENCLIINGGDTFDCEP